MTQIIPLEINDLALIALIIIMAIALSYWQKLGLETQLFFAGARAILQLLVVGYILLIIFALNNPIAVICILAVMITIAAIVAKNRISDQLKNLLPQVWLSLFISNTLTLGYGIIVVIQPENWYNPQYIIPLTGMILGNSMNAASLAGERLANSITTNRLEIETYLCLGATGKQAVTKYRREAIRASLIPTINQMMVVGLVSLPGMFTGQVLAGINPFNAALYQILILFLIALAGLITSVLVTQGMINKFFNQREQLIL